MKDILKLFGFAVIYAAIIFGGIIIGSVLGFYALKISQLLAGML